MKGADPGRMAEPGRELKFRVPSGAGPDSHDAFLGFRLGPGVARVASAVLSHCASPLPPWGEGALSLASCPPILPLLSPRVPLGHGWHKHTYTYMPRTAGV